MASTDRDALLALFRSANGEHWYQNVNWGSDEDLSLWHGVEVNHEGRVIALGLQSNNLQGASVRMHRMYRTTAVVIPALKR